MNKTYVFILAILVLLAACAQPQTAQAETPKVAGTSVTPPVKEFTIRAFQFGFDPDVIEVNKGDIVVINAYSDDVSHGLYIPGYGIEMAISGKQSTEQFIADKAGTFEFSCSIPCGSGHGAMTGTLIVRE